MNVLLRRVVPVFILVWVLSVMSSLNEVAIAATNLAKQPAVDVYVALGNEAGELKFFPSDLQFEPGHRYNLHLSNPSSQKHYFTAKDFADGIWSQKVDAGNVEIKGAIHELELWG
nr:biphenyl 2,3-dioxygenase [Acaryochloris sp. IP29b_bin.137]